MLLGKKKKEEKKKTTFIYFNLKDKNTRENSRVSMALLLLCGFFVLFCWYGHWFVICQGLYLRFGIWQEDLKTTRSHHLLFTSAWWHAIHFSWLTFSTRLLFSGETWGLSWKYQATPFLSGNIFFLTFLSFEKSLKAWPDVTLQDSF